jgi:hypothetical protein
VRDILAVVNTLIPPAAPEVQEQAVHSAPLLVGDLIPEGIASSIELKRTSKRIVSMAAKFTMGSCSIIVRDTQGDGRAETSLLRIRLDGLLADFELSNNDLTLDMGLSR